MSAALNPPVDIRGQSTTKQCPACERTLGRTLPKCPCGHRFNRHPRGTTKEFPADAKDSFGRSITKTCANCARIVSKRKETCPCGYVFPGGRDTERRRRVKAALAQGIQLAPGKPGPKPGTPFNRGDGRRDKLKPGRKPKFDFDAPPTDERIDALLAGPKREPEFDVKVRSDGGRDLVWDFGVTVTLTAAEWKVVKAAGK